MVDNGNCMHMCSSHAKLIHVTFSCDDDDGCIVAVPYHEPHIHAAFNVVCGFTCGQRTHIN